jgi:hypothetical protein
MDPGRFSAEEIAAVRLDPDLMLYAIELAAEPRNRKLDVAVISARAYVEYTEVDAEPGEDALGEDDVLGILALASRLSALFDVLEQGRLGNPAMREDERMLTVEAACTATLLQRDGRPSFQLLDFLAHLERARQESL